MASGSSKRKLPAVVSVRMSRHLQQALDRTARAHDQSAAAFLRQLAAREIRVVIDDDIFRSPPRNPICVPSPALAEISRLTAQLAMVGGGVVQLCKALREGRQPAHLAAEEVLADLRGCQRDLVELVQQLKVEVSK